jgi:hypothetical protein
VPPAGGRLLWPIKPRQTGGFGPGTRISGSLAAVFLLGGTALLASAAALDGEARGEPVQISAGALYDRSGRTYAAAGGLLGVAGAAALTCLVFYLVEKDGDRSATVFRF